MKARHLACAAVGLACLVPVAAEAQYTAYMPAVSQDQVAVNVRAAGFAPLSRPALRGAVYYLRAKSRGNVEMRVAVDARSGRVLSATPVSETQRAATASPVPDAPPRYAPRMSGSGYSETAPLPPADVPVASQPTPAAPLAAGPAKKLAAPRAPSTPATAAAAAPATSTPSEGTPAASASAAPAASTPAASTAATAAPPAEVTGAVPQAQAVKPPASAELRPAIPATTPAPAKPPAVTMVPIAPLE
jgi:hypothetical protein